MKVVTKVTFGRKFLKQLSRIPKPLQGKVRSWIFLVETSGVRVVRRSPGLHDEPLLGSRWGQRSIRLNKSYRLIYRIVNDDIHIELIEVHKHEY